MKTVLALCAHPDDAEFRCGGTLTLLAQREWDVHIATASTGDCGSAEEPSNVIGRRRREEAKAAAAVIGGTYHCLNGQDLQIYDNQEFRAAATALVREVNPDFILTHYPIDYMPDHEATSALGRFAAFTASLKNYNVGPCSAVPPTEDIIPVYYFTPTGGDDYFGNRINAPWFIDVSSVIEVKAEALASHASQRDWLRRQQGIDQYILTMKDWDAEAGALAGVPYAEGFFQHLGMSYPKTPVLQEALAEFYRKP